MAPFGYHPVPHSPGFWTHVSRPTVFTLCVDDFGIKYTTKDDANHLLNAIQSSYTISIDWEGKQYVGLSLNWNYDKRYVDLSMPGYIKKVLQRLLHPSPTRPQYSPHSCNRPAYGAKVQYVDHPPDSSFLDTKETLRVQTITGILLYYARAIDGTMLPALLDIAREQSKPTESTMTKCIRLLDYAATYPDATLRFHASDMILHTDTDAAYLVLPRARSRYAAYFYLSDKLRDYSTGNPKMNGAVLIECKGLKNVVSSTAEAETGGIFHTSQTAIPIARILTHVLKHPQPADGTPIVTDNATSKGIITKLIKPRKSKTWDMRHHWIEDRIKRKEIQLIWKPGKYNRADYFTKHHPPAHHKLMRPKYLINQATA